MARGWNGAVAAGDSCPLAATKGHQEERGTGADGAATASASAQESARGGW